jgi:hypothetical protein
MNRLKNFVESGYKKKGDVKNVNGMVLDEELSTRRNKVYVDPDTGKATHVIAGTDNLKDWANNLLIPLGLHHHTNRYKNSEKIQKKANEKYGKEKVDLVTHSQSGNIAENLQKRNLVGGENTTLNPAILGSHNKKLKVVKSRFDPVSLLTKTNKNDVVLKESSYNPLTEHSTAILEGKGLKKKMKLISNMHEQDLIKRMAKLSHDLHLHHDDVGHSDDLLKAYKLVGHGIKESIDGCTISGCGKGGKKTDKNVKQFNSWFKAIGQKFKPLMDKYVDPLLAAGTDRGVEMIGDLGKSPQEVAAEKAAEMFSGKKEKPTRAAPPSTLSTNEKRRLKAQQRKMDEEDEDEEEYEPPPRPKPRRQVPQYNEEEDYYEPPSRQAAYKPPVFSGPSSYERSFQSQPSQGRGVVGKFYKEKYGRGTGTKLGANLAGNIGRLADAGTNKVINDYLGGSGLKKKGRFVKGSQAAKDHMAAIRAKKGKGF